MTTRTTLRSLFAALAATAAVSGLAFAGLAVSAPASALAETVGAPTVEAPTAGATYSSGAVVPFRVTLVDPGATTAECAIDGGDSPTWGACPVDMRYTPGDGSTVDVGWDTEWLFGQNPGVDTVSLIQQNYHQDVNTATGKYASAQFPDPALWSRSTDCNTFPANDEYGFEKGQVTGTSLYNIFRLDCSIQGGHSGQQGREQLAGLTSGKHTISVRANDGYGNTSDVLTVSFRVGAVPSPSFTSKPSGRVRSRTAAFTIAAAEDGLAIKCWLDNAVYDSSCKSGALEFTDLADGVHTLRLTHVEADGTQSAPVTASWTVDLTPPAPVLSGYPGEIAGVTVSSGQIVQCGVNRAGVGFCSGYNNNGTHVIPAGHTWKSIQPSTYHACGLTSATDSSPNAILCWGESSARTEVPTGHTWKSLAVGFEDTCGITTEGEALCWGSHANQVPEGHSWSSIDVGRNYACGVTTEGEGLCWGDILYGRGSVPQGHSWKTIAPGYGATCGITTDADMICWTDSGVEVNFAAPPSDKKWDSVSSNMSENANNTMCGITKSWELYCWGNPYQPDSAKHPSGMFSEVSVKDSQLGSSCWVTTNGVPYCNGQKFFPTDFTPSGNGALVGDSASDPQFTIADFPGTTAECKANDGDWAACSSPVSIPFADALEGANEFQVRLTDGSITGPIKSFMWFKDSVAPDAPQVTGPVSAVTKRKAQITFTGDEGTTFRCKVDAGDWSACSSPVNLSGLVDGSHSVHVTQTDSAGNESAEASVDFTATYQPDVASRLAKGGSAMDTCVTIASGETKCFGFSDFGKTGSSAAKFFDFDPFALTADDTNPLLGLVGVAHDFFMTCGVLADTSAVCAGANFGALPVDADGMAYKGKGLILRGPAQPLLGIKQVQSYGDWDDSPLHGCAAMLDGHAYCWGHNWNGELGIGHTSEPSPYAVPVLDGSGNPLAGVKSISVGAKFSCALLSSGKVDCWGSNDSGQLATGDVGASNSVPAPVKAFPSDASLAQPAQPIDLTGVVQIDSGAAHTCALLESGKVDCWGYNSDMQTGFAFNANGGIPLVPLAFPVGAGYVGFTSLPAPLTGVTQISLGSNFSCAVVTGGQVYCWGSNINGQLGRTTPDSDVGDPRSSVLLGGGSPVLDSNGDPLANVTDIAAGYRHVCAIVRGGSLRCWGSSYFGENGSGHGRYADNTYADTNRAAAIDGFGDGPLAESFTRANGSPEALMVGPRGGSASFQLTSDKPVSGLEPEDFAVTGTSTGWAVDSVTADDSTNQAFTVQLRATEPTEGSLGLTLKVGGFADASGVPGPWIDMASSESFAVTIDTTAPDAPILSGEPSGTVSSNSASVTISGETSGTFECSVDGADFSACSSPLELTGLEDGDHALEVRQVDAAGNVSVDVARAEWSVDSQMPGVPSVEGNRSGFTSVTSASVAFQTDDSAVALCSVDGGDYSECDSPLALTSLGDGEHSVSVKQRNTAGSVSEASSVSWTVDTEAPGTPALSGLPSAYATTDFATAHVSVSEDHLTLSCSVDGSDFAPCEAQPAYDSESGKYVADESLSALDEGSHTFSVKSVDRAGNESAVAAGTWVVDTIAPDAPSVVSSRAGFTKMRTASVSFSGEPDATLECKLDGASDWSACDASPLALSGLEDGEHRLTVRQTDAAGNMSDEGTDSWTVDNAAPVAPGVRSNRSGTTNLRSATIEFTGETDAAFKCKLDSGSWVACEQSKALTNLGNGAHVLYAKQVDQAGNVSEQASASWTVSALTLTHAAVLNAGTTGSVRYLTELAQSGFAVSGASSGDGQTTYNWQRCSGVTAATCADWASSATWTVGKGDVGYRLRLIETFTSSDGVSVSSTTPLSGVVVPYSDDTPAIAIPDSLTAPAYGRVLSATGPTWRGFQGQPSASKISYRWQRCSSTRDLSCASIGGATKSTYTVSKYEVTKRMRLLVGVTVGSGSNLTIVWVPSAITGVVTNSGKATVAPSLVLGSGLSAPKRLTVLSVKPGTWAYTWLGKYSYKWQACETTETSSCTDISGQVRAVYIPASFLVGKRLRVLVTYTGHDGTRVTAATPISARVTG